ncbi:hypothetical protein, partial [Lysobacter sp. TAB13]|uniref:hypothetical protein n=1 Tax=Lysobacter sp. TAB13 TaxID=3233065 RepID=UPI003F948082
RRMSTSELSELALDAAMQVEDVLRNRSRQLDSVKTLMQALLRTVTSTSGDVADRFDLALLPIYETALGAAVAKPEKVRDFKHRVSEILANFVEADPSKGDEYLSKLRDFCVSVHDQALSQRIDLLRASQQHGGIAIRAY